MTKRHRRRPFSAKRPARLRGVTYFSPPDNGRHAGRAKTAGGAPQTKETIMKISARNQLAGTVEAVKKGAMNGHVALKLPDGSVIKGSVTNEAIEELGLVEGAAALAIAKSTDVIVSVE